MPEMTFEPAIAGITLRENNLALSEILGWCPAGSPRVEILPTDLARHVSNLELVFAATPFAKVSSAFAGAESIRIKTKEFVCMNSLGKSLT